MSSEQDYLDLLDDLVGRAKRRGADAADAVFIDSRSMSLAWRLGKQEHLERSENLDVGLRVFVGRKQAVVSSSDTKSDALDELVERAVAMAGTVPEDPYCGLADPSRIATEIPDIDSFDPDEPSVDELTRRASEGEAAALAVEGVTNSEGAEAAWGHSTVALAATNGFAQTYSGSRHSLSASVIAGEGTGMETDYDFASAVFGADLRAAAEIGRSAGEKAVRRLKPRKVPSAQVPMVYDPRVSRSVLGHLSSAINGSAVARGTTFLKDSMGKRILPEGVTVVDDPHRKRGLASRPFDGEGIATRRYELIADGTLTTWLLDLSSARQLGLETTGHASRGTSSPPSPSSSNLYMEPGARSPEEMIADIEQGFYITDMMGFGINYVTGDYSRGANGFWIENGKLAYPVSEVTVAGNLKDMFANLTPADDLEFRFGTNAPTLRIDGMTLAGN